METLAGFLATGKLGPLEFGMTGEQVRHVLGAPEDVSVQKNPSIWKYGSLELGFTKAKGDAESRLNFIGLYLRASATALPSALEWRGTRPDEVAIREPFDAFLDSEALKEQSTENPEWGHVVFRSGVRAVFDGAMLQSIQGMQKTPASQKQISLSIPQEIWDSIRAEAKRLNLPPAQLCTQWIAQQAKRSEAMPMRIG